MRINNKTFQNHIASSQYTKAMAIETSSQYHKWEKIFNLHAMQLQEQKNMVSGKKVIA